MEHYHVLKEVFGFDSFRKGQEAVIQQILEGNSALAVFPTGSGKSLCYQLPALLLDGLTIVISPLIALMKDQVDFLLERSIPVARLDSSLNADETRAVYSSIKQGKLKLLYVAPERISNERFFAAIESVNISLMVIDEAHCISEWGHNFRPEYLKLAIAAQKLKVDRVLALTATATEKVVQDICDEFCISDDAYVNTGFYRPNLELLFSPTSLSKRFEALLERLKSTTAGPTIVYVTLQKEAEDLAKQLSGAGQPARAYHAGMKSEIRSSIQDWFMASDDGIVVATIAFGMGIDKSNIRRVYHYNLPKTLENYSQEIGRAGRDGLPSVCEVLGSEEDLVVLENFIYGDTPTKKAIQSFVEFILSQEPKFDISIYHLSQMTDIRPLVLGTLLTYLELEGVIQFTSPFYSEYKFKYLQKKEDLLDQFDTNRRSFLENIFAQSNEKKTWSYLNIDEAASQLNEERSRIVKAFNFLEEKKLLEVAVTGLRQGMLLLEKADISELTEKLLKKVAFNEKSNLERTHQVIDLLNVDSCKTSYLLNYFGEKLEDSCAHCSFCKEGKSSKIMPHERDLNGDELDSLNAYKKELPLGNVSLRESARFLCGISSPKISRNRLSRHELFGTFEKVPFNSVLAALS